MSLVGIEDIRAAAANLAGIAVHTPLLESLAHPGLWLKPENLQPIGAFKLRGAVNAVARLAPEVRAAGVAADSSGNHGQALAYAARRFGVACVVVMPDVAPQFKIDAVRALGAEVVLAPPADRLVRLNQIVAERGLVPIPPFDHPDVIAGQGTVGLEIVADLPDVAAVLVPVGGGGLASGLSTAVKALRPEALVIGVEPELAGDAADSLRQGRIAQWSTDLTYRTAADGLRTNLSDLTFAHLRAHLDGIITVTEAEILTTVAEIVRTARIVAEPSGAVAPSAWLHHRKELAERFNLHSGPTVAVITGGNIAPQALAKLLDQET
jgi:threonine dehydratase